jgi:hypothetical protein
MDLFQRGLAGPRFGSGLDVAGRVLPSSAQRVREGAEVDQNGSGLVLTAEMITVDDRIRGGSHGPVPGSYRET